MVFCSFNTICTTSDDVVFCVPTFTFKFLLSISATETTLDIYLLLTGSNHTVCQIPETGVYQIAWGFFTCFPLGIYDSFVGSQTFTTSFWLPDVKKGVISNLNGTYPPVCVPIFTSFKYISAFQSTAPKCKRIFLPLQLEGILKVLLYHNSFSLPNSFCTPERLDSTAKGTSIFPSNFCGSFCPKGKIAYSHNPLRFNQLSRSIIGRGYSESILSRLSVSAHAVLILSPAGFH